MENKIVVHTKDGGIHKGVLFTDRCRSVAEPVHYRIERIKE